MAKRKEDKYKLKIDPDSIVSVSELRKNLSKYGEIAKTSPIFIFIRNKPEYMMIGYEIFEKMMEKIKGTDMYDDWVKDRKERNNEITEKEFKSALGKAERGEKSIL